LFFNLNYSKKEEISKYSLEIEFNIKKPLYRAIIFGFFSSIAFIAIILANLANNDGNINYTLFITAILLFAVSAGFLFNLFNKK